MTIRKAFEQYLIAEKWTFNSHWLFSLDYYWSFSPDAKWLISPDANKRLSFEFEKEVRAIIFDHTKSGDLGIEVAVDLSELLKGVYISPYAPKWFKEIVEDILSKYNYNIEVQMSGMVELPF